MTVKISHNEVTKAVLVFFSCASLPVLATWDICSGNRHVLHEETNVLAQNMWDMSTINTVHSAYMLRASTDFHKEEVPSMLHVFSSIKQRVYFRWHAFQKRVLRWIKPQTTSFVLGTLADVTRGKAELLAENALLRHQLIILHRQAKRPVYRKTDRLLLVLLARMVGTWKQALFLVQEDDGPSMASRALPSVLEAQIKSACEKSEALARNHQLDQGDGSEESALGSRTYPWRTPQVGYSRE